MSQSDPPPPTVAPRTASDRARWRRRLSDRRVVWSLLLTVGSLAATVASATLYVTTTQNGILTSKVTNSPGGECGWVALSTTNVVGSGSLSGPNYISFSPALSTTTVVQTTTATFSQFGTGSGGYEYLVDEVAFGCLVATAGAQIPFTITATGTSNPHASWIVMEVSTSANTPGTNPTTGTPCDKTGGDLYLPYGATASTPVSYSGGFTTYSGGNVYTFSANVTSPALTDDSCTANAAPTQTTIPTLTIPTTVNTLTEYYWVSFVVTGAATGGGTPNPSFTLGFS